MRTFLKLKHWQLFSLLIGLPFLAYLIWIFNFVSTVTTLASDDIEPEPGLVLGTISWMLPVVLVVVAVHLAWQWTLAHALHARLPEGVSLNLTVLRGALIFQVVYVFLILLGVYWLFGQMADDPENLEGTFSVVFPIAVVLMLLGNLVAIASQFYVYYFNGKALKSVETGKEALISDYIGESALFWIYPIGLWFLQPRVNRLFAE